MSSLDVSGRLHTPLGNFDSHSGTRPPTYFESFQWVSRFKGRLFPQQGARLFFALLALAVALAAGLPRD